jgi:hypothetical protein
MYDVLTHTMSQALQALLPATFAALWFRIRSDRSGTAGVVFGVILALTATPAIASAFQSSARQALWEAAFATSALAIALACLSHVRSVRGGAEPTRVPMAVAIVSASVALVVVRQTIEIQVVFAAALQSASPDPLTAISAAIAIGVLASAAWLLSARWIGKRAVETAVVTFAALFAAQLAIYAFHESTEAGLLPWSAAMHLATEPYGPDGMYGRYLSVLLAVIPAAALIPWQRLTAGIQARVQAFAGPARVVPATIAALLVATAGAICLGTNDRADSTAQQRVDMTSISASAHVLFRNTSPEQHFGKLSAAPLGRPLAERTASTLTCARISFAAGRGICLQANRTPIFSTFVTVLFDKTLTVTRTLPLQVGNPSRTRVSPDGRVGAITVFRSGQYIATSFSTRTTIIDMETGDELGDLEDFTTWRNGAKFKAADFNFWGVTFARDGNVFYATLRTAQGATGPKTYLVRGDLALRKLVVLRENVECPALSPDNRLIAFKKRVGPDSDPWRIHILDVATLADRPLSVERRSIDDQIEWLDDAHVLYEAQRPTAAQGWDVWMAPIDNSAAPRVFIPNAASPIIVP